METQLKQAYAAEAQVTRLANTVSILTAYLDGTPQDAPFPEPVASELRLLSGTLHQISCLQGQSLGRSLASLVVARRQLWLSQARVPDADKTALLEAPISLGHTFGLAALTITRTVPIPTALLGDLRHHLQVTMAAGNQTLPRERGNLGHGAPMQQHSKRQFQDRRPRQPPQRAPPQSQQPQQGP
ncbi:UNVERIFIED_CONTAM: hypothetical protein FKN15_076679 [Acipenser sinensis]